MATIQNINVGTTTNDGTGDTLRNAFIKTNDNFTSVNSDLALKATLASPTITGTLTTVNDTVINSIKVGKGAGNILSNTTVGNNSLTANTSGVYNSAFGLGSISSNQGGSRNAAFGADSLFYNISGSFNTAIGAAALINTTGSDNTGVGYGAGQANTSFSNITCLGANTEATASNQVNLGNTAVNSLRCNVTSISSLSDERDKTDIVEITEGLDFVSKLKPVTFTWNQRDGNRVGIKSAGFIAQDLLELQNDSLIGENLDLVSENDEKLEARYANLLPVMIKAIQELKAEIELLKTN